MAFSLTKLNQTKALSAGLRVLIAKYEREAIVNLKGKIKVDLQLDETRQHLRQTRAQEYPETVQCPTTS